ncbi:MAG: glycosyltransferase [Candidatus Marsarchaeota archaeon]|nr:glycosyltransferase [Candidatus Marsarchaeota archaeon]
MDVYIVIPARNEKDRIGRTLDDYSRLEFHSRKARVVVVSESDDGTDDIVRKFEKRNSNITLLKATSGSGKGGAIIKGFRYAMARSGRCIIGFADADDAVTAREFSRLLERLNSSKIVDGVIASRYSDGGSIEGRIGVGRKAASRAYNLLVRSLFRIGFSDTQCGAKVFKSETLRKVIGLVDINGMSFDINLLYELKIKGYTVVEQGVRYRQKNDGTNIRILRNSPQMLVAALGFRAYKSRFVRLFPKAVVRHIYKRIDRW